LSEVFEEIRDKTVAISSMGCRANQYDSSAMAITLRRAGWRLVDFNSSADAYILNTCTVTHKADADARHLVRRAHRQNPEATILVTGCYAQTDPQALAGIEGVSFIFGNDQKGSILDYLNQVQPLKPQVIVNDLFKEKAIFTSHFGAHTERSRAFLKIQDGCNQMCSYCVIPFARGKNRSLAPEEVLKQLKLLAQQGFYEAVLTGIHIGTYGVDLDLPGTLLDLMRKIEEEKPIHRVRLSSIDPEEVSEEMIKFLSQSQVFCAYLHLPVQSGDDQILKLMRRRYQVADFENLAWKLKEKIPQICLGTDVMVGFPYEDEERFQSGYELIKKLPLDYLHVFPYSAKKKTRAASFLSQVSSSIKKERVKKFIQLSQDKKEKFYQNALGTETELVIEESSSEELPGYLKGTSRNYIPVYLLAGGFPKKSLLQATLTHYEGGKVFGEINKRR